MTDDPARGIDAASRYAIELLGRITQFEMSDDALRTEFDLPPDHPINRVELMEVDTVMVDQIAGYLMIEEELDDDFDNPDEHDNVLNIGMFIYGWEQTKLLNDG